MACVENQKLTLRNNFNARWFDSNRKYNIRPSQIPMQSTRSDSKCNTSFTNPKCVFCKINNISWRAISKFTFVDSLFESHRIDSSGTKIQDQPRYSFAFFEKLFWITITKHLSNNGDLKFLSHNSLILNYYLSIPTKMACPNLI
jgi:hypothetical protein